MKPLLTPDSVEDVRRLVASRSDDDLAIRLRRQVLVELPDEIRTALPTTNWTFLVGGWTDPILASLPPSSRELQLGREVEELTSVGVTKLIGYVPHGWESNLASNFRQHGIVQVAVGPSVLATPIVTDRLGDVVTILPLLGNPPTVTMPGSEDQILHGYPPVDLRWGEELDRNAEASLLYRKMLRLATRLPERPPGEAVELLMEAQAAHWYEGDVDRTAAHEALISARRRIDQERRVPPDWTKVTQLDWDADGSVEAHLENRDVSVVVDPAEGLIKSVDLKSEGHPLSYLPGLPPWRIARVLEGQQTHRLTLDLEAVVEARDQIIVEMSHPHLEVGLELRGQELHFSYRPRTDPSYDRLGPEMGFAFAGAVQVRVDGGGWLTIDAPRALTGHRFRFDDGSRQVLVSLAQPGDLFVTMVGGGVVVWANWAMGTGEHRMSIFLTG